MAGSQLTSILRHIRHLVGGGDGGAASDRQLLHRYAECGDSDAFATLVERHGPLALGVCQRVLGNSHDAEDAFQAVFVVLARKAGASGWQESIGPWLHEVAHRVALRARGRAIRRAEHERRAADMRPSGAMATAEPTWADLRGVLDDELRRLPVKYRAPLLLCYLEGKSNEEAAQQLGWPAGTVKSRLSRGRDLLRERLTRRGLALSAPALVAMLGRDAVAAVPASLADSAIKAAQLVAAGQAVGGLTGSAAALAQGALRAMWFSKAKKIALVGVLGLLAASWLTYHTLLAANPAAANKEVVLPKDPKAVVLSMEVRGGMIANKTADPFLQIQADGKVIQTDRISGAKKESKLTPAELQELLRFVVYQNDFLNADPKKVPPGGNLPVAVTDGTTTTIRVHANNKQHEASCYMASFALANNPNAKPLVQYAAVEWRLNQLAYFVGLAPVADANPPAAIALPKDPKAVVLSMTVSHKEIPTRKEVRPDGGTNIFQGSPRADQVLQIQADGKVLVTNRVSGAKKETQLTASQLQDVLRFMIRENDFFNQASIKLPDKDNADARKLVISVQTGDKQHEVSVDGRWVDAKGKIGPTCSWLNNLARTYVWPSGTGWEY
jgi:RNA polymerase sigma factor (sigma-70 family)